MNYSQFVSKYNGKGVDWDGQFGNQCVDLVAQYVKEVYGAEPIYANAADWWAGFTGQVAQKFTKVANGPTNVPKQGDIMIYSKDLPGSGGYGHIEIFDKKTGPGRYQSFSQNWGGQYAHMVEHTDNYKYVLGWLTPKATSNPSTGGNMLKFETTAQVNEGYKMGRGKSGTSAELKSWVGGDVVNFFRLMKKEVDARINAQKARADKAEAQVADLKKQLANAGGGTSQDAEQASWWRDLVNKIKRS